MPSSLPIPRPFLKWAGGKGQLADILLQHRPARFQTYHEPFLGSGALFFRLYREGLIHHAMLSDINRELIDTYLAVRDHVCEVIRILAEYPYQRDFYYQLRDKDPATLSLPQRAARMIYLNKTGYNGLYRVNRQGKFNVPFGRHKNPKYLDEENLLAVSRALQDVQIYCATFECVLEWARPQDWVYFDPPYAPVSATASFTAYHAGGFGSEQQTQLRDLCLQLSARGVLVMVSNSDTPLVRQLYGQWPFQIETVGARRAINCQSDKRGQVNELLITNYGR